MIPELNGDFLQWLRGFYYVAKTGSVRRAAELMHRNPSTISYQLRSLETELNTVLFDRYKKSLQITPEGKKLLGWTITTFETLQSMRSAVGTTDGRLQGDIFLGATLPVAIMAVDAIAAFRAENPQVNIRIQRALSSEIVQAVKESRLDFGLTGMPALPKQDTMEILLKARPLLVMRKDSIWDIPPIPTEADLERLPFVIFQTSLEESEQPTPTLQYAARRLQKNTVISVNNYHLIMQFVRCDVGVAIMDELCYRATMFGSDWSSIVSCPLDHLLPNVLYGILVRRHKHISPQAQALMDALRRHFIELAAQPFGPTFLAGQTQKGGQPTAARPRRKASSRKGD